METSILLAKFWGWYLVIFFFILSYKPTRIQLIFKYIRDYKFSILVAFIAIIIGLLNILFHNTWSADWTVIITLIGWIALIKGISLFIFPRRFAKWVVYARNKLKLVQVVYVLLFILGLFLLNAGYQLVEY